MHGHGCFTTREVAAGEEVARSRVLLVFPPEEFELLGRTRVKHYLFYVRDGAGDEPPYHTALAMGPDQLLQPLRRPELRFPCR